MTTGVVVALRQGRGATMEWVDAIAGWVLALRAAGRPDTTVELRLYQLRRVAAAMAPAGPWTVTGDHLVAWLGGQVWSPSTRRSYRSALRSFYGWAHGCGHVEVDPSRAVQPVRPSDPDPRPTPDEAYRAALARADERTRLMIRLAAELGLRRGEVARVHVEDLERDLTGWTLRVRGKGARVRWLPLSDGLAVVLRSWATAAGAGWLFPGRDEGHLSPHWVGHLVSEVLPGAWSMHSLRHRFATIAYSHDRDTFTVQELLGHRSPVTTRMYVRVPSDALRRTVLAVAAAG